jgi:hypothetical protein
MKYFTKYFRNACISLVLITPETSVVENSVLLPHVLLAASFSYNCFRILHVCHKETMKKQTVVVNGYEDISDNSINNIHQKLYTLYLNNLFYS